MRGTLRSALHKFFIAEYFGTARMFLGYQRESKLEVVGDLRLFLQMIFTHLDLIDPDSVAIIFKRNRNKRDMLHAAKVLTFKFCQRVEDR